MRPITSLFGSRKLCLLMVSAIFIVSRLIYYWLGVRFDTGPLLSYWQVIDPVLLRDAPWQSLVYLRTQLPGLNLYIAVIMHFFPQHSVAAFHATYLGLGLMLAICLFLLLDRLRVSRPLAVVIAVICVISPVTVLYENWLFYEYPLAVLFCVSALFLHRYASSGHRIDGIMFFTSLACIALLRVIYHLVWFWVIVALMIYALPRYRRRTVLCAAIPGAVLCMIYLKSLILFGLWMPGSDVFGSINLAHLTSDAVPLDVLATMTSRGTISPILLPILRNSWKDEALVDIVKIPPRTGVRILDERFKSTGGINMDSLWMAAIGRQLRQDSLSVLRSHPKAVLTRVRNNVVLYFLPADVGWPFDGTQRPNRQVLSRLLRGFDLITAGYQPPYYTFISYVTIPFLLWFGLGRSARWLKRAIQRPNGNARDLTIVFAFGNIAYLTAVIILYDYADQNRILFEVFPLFTILLGLLIVFVMWRFRISQSWIRRFSKA
jgi:hypothetical protein